MVVRVLGTGRRWADRSHPIIAASRVDGNRSNTGFSGSFSIFLKTLRRACRDEMLAFAITM